jgi:hypothetical protein
MNFPIQLISRENWSFKKILRHILVTRNSRSLIPDCPKQVQKLKYSTLLPAFSCTANRDMSLQMLYIAHKCLLSYNPAYLRNLSTVQSTSTTRFPSVITLKHPYNPCRLKVSSRSFYHSAPALWNILPK